MGKPVNRYSLEHAEVKNNFKMFGPLGVMTPCCPKHLVNLMRIDPTIANVETMVQNFIFT